MSDHGRYHRPQMERPSSDSRGTVQGIDERLRPFLARIGVPMLRISLGVVFVWFGLLKVFDVSPVSELVAKTIYWFDPDVVVPALGVFEVFVGVVPDRGPADADRRSRSSSCRWRARSSCW